MSNLTEKAIQEAFVKLLNERPLDKITVREIAGECNLGKYVTGDKERHQKLNDFLATMGW